MNVNHKRYAHQCDQNKVYIYIYIRRDAKE